MLHVLVAFQKHPSLNSATGKSSRIRDFGQGMAKIYTYNKYIYLVFNSSLIILKLYNCFSLTLCIFFYANQMLPSIYFEQMTPKRNYIEFERARKERKREHLQNLQVEMWAQGHMFHDHQQGHYSRNASQKVGLGTHTWWILHMALEEPQNLQNKREEGCYNDWS